MSINFAPNQLTLSFFYRIFVPLSIFRRRSSLRCFLLLLRLLFCESICVSPFNSSPLRFFDSAPFISKARSGRFFHLRAALHVFRQINCALVIFSRGLCLAPFLGRKKEDNLEKKFSRGVISEVLPLCSFRFCFLCIGAELPIHN